MIEMILFDMDGTLWNTINTTTKAAFIISEKYDDVNEITKEIVTKSMGLGFSDVAEKYMPYLEKNRREKVLREIMDKNLEIIKEEGADTYPFVSEVIKELSKTYKLGIITNNFTEYAKTFVDKASLNDYFIDYVGASSLNMTKADAIKYIMKKHNISKAVYVGDTKGDKDASEEANVTFIHAKYGIDKDLETLYYINNFSDLINLVNKINKLNLEY